ncbi:MAG: hypothetical protein E6Q89_02120 [Bacteroidia bacterium]|jgi:hypothetical protein|nr:MAG: hypothetical protein E6Q89_02120 [Bacteroidia bacterium]
MIKEELLEEFIDASGETPNIDILRQIYYSTDTQTDKIELLTAINCMALIEAAYYVNDNSEKIYPIICQLIDWAEKIGILANMLAGNGYLSFICCDNTEVRDLLWSKATGKQKIEMLTACEYSAFKNASSPVKFKQLLDFAAELNIFSDKLPGYAYFTFVCCNNIEMRELLWTKASTKQKVEMLTYWEYSVFEKAKSEEELKQLYSYIKEALAIEGKPLLESDLFSSLKINCTKVPDALIQFFYSKDEFSSEGDYDIMGKGGIIEVSDQTEGYS